MKTLKYSSCLKYYGALLVTMLIIVWSLFFNHFTVINESKSFIINYSSWGKAIFYTGVFMLDSFVIALIFFLKNKYLKWPLLVILLILLLGDITYKSINGNEVFYDDMQMIINAQEHIGGAISMYFQQWFFRFVLITFLLLCLSYVIKKYKLHFLSSLKFVPLLLISLILTYGIIHNSNGNRNSFPSFHKIITLSIYSLGYGIYGGEREPVTDSVSESSRFNHIILIVDESIRGDLLHINEGPKENTPFLNSIMNDKLVNYGVASSASVCSNASNIIILSGIRLNELPDINNRTRKAPTLFQYANKAGYKTAFIDAQSLSNKPDGYMTWDDKSYLDFDLQVKSKFNVKNEFELDGYSIELLNNVILNSNKSFTYLIKNGSHFPYQRTYPEAMEVFTPTKEITDWDPSHKEYVMNSYHNSILWNVDVFWEKIDSLLKDKEDVLVIYTSDHGQNIFNHDEIIATHCYKGPSPSEMAKVPFFFYSSDTTFITEAKIQADKLKNKLSHFNIFPTVLDLMGYNPTFINQNYSKSIFQKSYKVTRRTFISGDLYGRSDLYLNDF